MSFSGRTFTLGPLRIQHRHNGSWSARWGRRTMRLNTRRRRRRLGPWRQTSFRTATGYRRW